MTGTGGGTWLQFGLVPHPERTGTLYPALDAVAREAVRDGLVGDFFFMHKPPGMRVRFEAAQGAAPVLRERLRDWRDEGLLADWRHGVYEPESSLFGGPASMRSVHRVFTADSLAWLGYHRLVLEGGKPGPAWAMSLLLIRSLLATLRIVGWEDLDVWERVRRHRRLAPAAATDPRLLLLAQALRTAWPSQAALAAKLSPEAVELAEEYEKAVAGEGERWYGDYFESGSAVMGPRAVASYVILFHWNRAKLPAWRQALLTEALLVRSPDGAW